MPGFPFLKLRFLTEIAVCRGMDTQPEFSGGLKIAFTKVRIKKTASLDSSFPPGCGEKAGGPVHRRMRPQPAGLFPPFSEKTSMLSFAICHGLQYSN